MAKKYEVLPESVIDDEDFEFKDEILNIVKNENKIALDLQTYCKNPMTAYRRFYKAAAEAQQNGEFREYDLLFDILIDPCEVDWSDNSPLNNYPKTMEEYGYVLGLECLDEGLWYIWASIKRERMAA